MASGSYDCTIQLWNVKTWKPEVLYRGTDIVTNLIWMENGKLLCLGIYQQSNNHLNIQKRKLEHELQADRTTNWGIAYIVSQPILASGGGDKVIRIWYFRENHFKIQSERTYRSYSLCFVFI